MIEAIRKTPIAAACALALIASLAAPGVPWAYASALAYEGDASGAAYVDEDDDGYDDVTDEWIGYGTAAALEAKPEREPASPSSASASPSSSGGATADGSDGGNADGGDKSKSSADGDFERRDPGSGQDGKEKDEPASSAFTFAGTGTTVDNATSDDGVEFFTIKAEGDEVYYLVVDRRSGTDNVYLLNAVTGTDLQALAENGSINLGAPAVAAPKAEEGANAAEKKDDRPQQQGAPEWLAYLAVVAIVGGGAFAYYRFKVKPEREESKVDEREVRSFESDGIYPPEGFAQYDGSWK